MRFPKSIKIGSIYYKIIISSDNDDMHEAADEAGHINYAGRYISLYSKKSEQNKRDSLVHEIIHGIFRHTNLDTTFGSNREEYVERLETAFCMVFEDNPKLLKLLLEKGQKN